MRRFTIAALAMSGLFAVAQVLTVSPDAHVRASTGLTKSEQARLLPALQSATGDDRPDLLNSFRAYKESLAKTGTPAIIAISAKDCGVHSNCPFLVLLQHGSADVLILNSVAGDWNLKDTRHHGFRDIILTNYQGIRQLVSTWLYDGQSYRVSACMDRTSDGAQHETPAVQCGF